MAYRLKNTYNTSRIVINLSDREAAGKTESEVVAEHLTSDFDTQWGDGRVRGDEFVREVYASLVEKSAFNGKVAFDRVVVTRP